MNKTTYLFIRNLGAYWMDQEEEMIRTFRELIRRVELTDENVLFESKDEMEKMNSELFGKDFIRLLSKAECRIKRDNRIARNGQ